MAKPDKKPVTSKNAEDRNSYRGSDVKMFLKQLGYADTDKVWGAENFTEDEIQGMRDRAVRLDKEGSRDYEIKKSGNKHGVGYADYDIGDDSRRGGRFSSTVVGGSTGGHTQRGLGQYQYRMGDNDQVYSADQYNFSNLVKAAAEKSGKFDYSDDMTNLEKLGALGSYALDNDTSIGSKAYRLLRGGAGIWGWGDDEGAPVRVPLGTPEELGLSREFVETMPSLKEYDEQVGLEGILSGARNKRLREDKEAKWDRQRENREARQSNARSAGYGRTSVPKEDAHPSRATLIREALESRSIHDPSVKERALAYHQEAGEPIRKPEPVVATETDSPIPGVVREERPKSEPYTIKSGDSLSKIAAKYGTTVQALREANNIGKDGKIYVGRTLNLGNVSPSRKEPAKSEAREESSGGWPTETRREGPTGASKEEATKKPTTYQIQSGDSLSKIAAKMGTTVKALREANGIKDADKIYVGRTLKL